MRLIICTVGTSIANGCASLRGYQQKTTSWKDPATDLVAEIEKKLSGVDLKEIDSVRRTSAELNSLQRLDLVADDRIALLATDTADGHCCADQLHQAIVKTFSLSADAVEVVRIPG